MLQFLSFRADLAMRYGVQEAVFLHQIVYWTQYNRSENRHFYQGRFWSNHTRKGLAKLYPIWSEDQIKRMIGKLREKGALLVGDFSVESMDHTNWYAPSDEILALYDGALGQSPGPGEIAQSIGRNDPGARAKSPNHYIRSKEDIEKKPPIIPQGISALVSAYAGEDGELRETILGLLENRAALRPKPSPVRTERAMRGILSKLDKLSGGDRALKLALLDTAVQHNWLTVYPLKPDERPASGPDPYKDEGEDGI